VILVKIIERNVYKSRRGHTMNKFKKFKKMITEKFIKYEFESLEIQLETKSNLVENPFFDTLSKIYFQISKISALPEFNKPYITDILEDGRIEFIVPEETKEHPTTDKFSTLEYVKNSDEDAIPFYTFDIMGNKTGKKTMENLNKRELEFLLFLQNRKVYRLSKNEFIQYAGTKFNSIFFKNWTKMNDIYKNKDLEEKMLYLIPQYELSFNTILNVLNSHMEKNPDKPISLSMETKIITIFESFDKKVLEVEQKMKEMKLLEDEGFEKSLEELLDIELDILEKNEQLQREA
jgi:hypothetical protein